ncbi:bifunctional diaminohydroxyphosphoribosylaminopyrimidine deaminase/5-amino-6-(5-phosphoribosylamino)uracil reductase RibD [Leuconostoc rapi]|uniref:bifunctional diaminohydroxyphosphoribosylaminopyrimidine deaminase/5-amino-6-(5-phosphoribosylamino)uracil reductase RibD n=1 Tax=Leuconostoc rapi TaxID=1406906 RepID=UPI00195DE6E6|nr:bifunctional diaminohydroxyphosphoribosylaminopyrimidine deaminase/5-amino-6-(5-phosphoribosylamino)uracil reductase RibD [Leuconostoc rapi]MBM7435755.1 diaminohydroxyphosphoribosylaminopyrimidine deaminase/5-amino-6-(5-phosphoribosylamino)uracil reductase [Leuconostoc rapi]
MNDLTFMALAAQEATKAVAYKTFENPRVGAIIVQNNQIIATGYHDVFGQAHAEINAFNHLKDKNQIIGATMYVTLEPCSSSGKVGSCAKAMSTWGLRRVVIGSIDPNPTTNGQGVALLKASGVEVAVLHTNHSACLNPEFYYYFQSKKPYVQLKLVVSKDGFVSSGHHKRTKLTDDRADIDVHQERAKRSAIMIGSETFLVDKPQLTIRLVDSGHQQPMRVVIDRRGRLQNNHFDFSNRWIIYTENMAFANQSHNVYLMTHGLAGVLRHLAQQNIQSVMIEGGPKLMNAFIAENLWQEKLIYETDVTLGSGVPGVICKQMPESETRVGNAVKRRYIND